MEPFFAQSAGSDGLVTREQRGGVDGGCSRGNSASATTDCIITVARDIEPRRNRLPRLRVEPGWHWPSVSRIGEWRERAQDISHQGIPFPPKWRELARTR